MLFANFVTKSSVDAVRCTTMTTSTEDFEHQPTFSGVLYSVLGQTNALIRKCTAINKKNDDRRAIFEKCKVIAYRSHAQ